MIPPAPSVVMAAAAWGGTSVAGVDDATLDAALQLARRNHVAGRLARVYGDRLAAERARVEAMTRSLRENIAAVAALLDRAGVTAVLVKLDPAADCEYSNFDIVVGDDLAAARRALSGWAVRTSGHPLEPDKILLHPAAGPAAHVHRHLSWFGIDVISAERLRAGALGAGQRGLLLPSSENALRSYVAHGLFQNLTVDLAELIAVRELLTPAVVVAARSAAREEGWARGYDRAVAAIRRTATRLDAGLAPRLPVVLPLLPATMTGVEHAAALARHGRPRMAAREVALRAPLVVAKRRRAWREKEGCGDTALVGISGPDGVGKSTAVRAAVALISSEGGAAVSLHPYGCVVCRTFGRFARPAGRSGPAASSRGLHALIDSAEMALRLRLALLRAGLRRRRIAERGITVVITDRSPLDGLVKHAPTAAARSRAWLTRLARRYDRIVLLDAPASLLAEQDHEHPEVDLEARRGDFASWTNEMGMVVRLPTAGRQPGQIAAELVGSLRWKPAGFDAGDGDVTGPAAIEVEGRAFTPAPKR